ncbi:MAG: hypothetical protein WCD52_19880 [Xanthobacteraceae bacterium]
MPALTTRGMIQRNEVFRFLEIATLPADSISAAEKREASARPRWRLLNKTYFFGEHGATHPQSA